MVYKQNLLSLKNEIENQKKNGSWGVIQKATSSPHHIILRMRRPGQSYYLFLGRGGNFQGASFCDEGIPSPLRVIDSFLEYIRKNLVGARISEISVDSEDRVIHIAYLKNKEEGVFSLFWKGNNLLFINSQFEKKKLINFYSWKTGKEKIDELKLGEVINLHKSIFDQEGRRRFDRENQNLKSFDLNKYINFVEETLKKNKNRKRSLNKLEKKILNIQKDLERIEQWPLLKDFIENNDLSDTRILKLNSFRIDLKNLKGHYKKRDRVFEKIKGFKKGTEILKQRIENTSLELSRFQARESSVAVKEEFNILNPLNVEKKKKEKNTSSPSKDFVAYKINRLNLKLYIGKSAKGNDYIRGQLATKSDWWVHLDGYTGSHCIIKTDARPSMEVLSIVSSAIRDMNQLTIETIPILLCQVKNLKGVKGTPGKVNYKNEKRLSLDYDKIWDNQVTQLDI